MAFVAHLVHVFREVRRVLAEDGTLWLNLGDSYASTSKGGGGGPGLSSISGTHNSIHGGRFAPRACDLASIGVKIKDLIGIPWRVAFALQADGWYLRSDVIWAKPNPMPESVTDRPTKAHEYVFLLTKSERYFYDAEAVKEPALHGARGSSFTRGKTLAVAEQQRPVGRGERTESETRNIRSVWHIATQPYRGAHFATMPRSLAERCVLAGSALGQLILDPFNGAATTGVAALTHDRRYIGIDLNPEYIQLSAERLAQVKR